MKKAIVPLWISLVFSLIAVGLLITFYFMFLGGSRAPATMVVAESHYTSANNMLINYLNTPVVVKNEQISMPDLIRLWYYKQNEYGPNLKALSEDMMKKSTLDHVDDAGNIVSSQIFWVGIYEPEEYKKGVLKQFIGRPIIEFNRPYPYPAVMEQVSTPVPISEVRAVFVVVGSGEIV